MTDLTEQSLIDLMEHIRREAKGPLFFRPTHVYWDEERQCIVFVRLDPASQFGASEAGVGE